MWDLAIPEGNLRDDLGAWADAGFNGATIFLTGHTSSLEKSLRGIAAFKHEYASKDSLPYVVRTASDLEGGRSGLGCVLALQDGSSIGESPELIAQFHLLGVRQIGLAHNTRNQLADGCSEVGNAGLSNLGVAFVVEMNSRAMMIDLSHTGERSTFETMDLSEQPCIFSHSNPSEMFGHYRNISRSQIAACAARGGVIGISGQRDLLGGREDLAMAVYECIDHVTSLVGSEHAALGLNWQPELRAAETVEWAADQSWWPDRGSNGGKPLYAERMAPSLSSEVEQILLDHGYDRASVDAILYGNAVRLYRQVLR